MAKGYSLHIGLNYVDPSHYNNWNGRLKCCINDANAMLQIAQQEGYIHSTTLFNEEATRENVINTLSQYSRELNEDDILMLTYSGHGSSLPDLNEDEKDNKDETWCLYNGMLVDDELFEMYSTFKKNVRILVISDSCHSGTVTRGNDGIEKDENIRNGLRAKRMEKGMSETVYRKKETFYNTILQNEKIDLKKLQANILLLGACQDDQKAYEGTGRYGNFTEQLLRIWDNGGFNKNYITFHKMIKEKMSKDQVPNLNHFGKRKRRMSKQVPFKIKIEYKSLTVLDKVVDKIV